MIMLIPNSHLELNSSNKTSSWFAPENNPSEMFQITNQRNQQQTMQKIQYQSRQQDLQQMQNDINAKDAQMQINNKTNLILLESKPIIHQDNIKTTKATAYDLDGLMDDFMPINSVLTNKILTFANIDQIPKLLKLLAFITIQMNNIKDNKLISSEYVRQQLENIFGHNKITSLMANRIIASCLHTFQSSANLGNTIPRKTNNIGNKLLDLYRKYNNNRATDVDKKLSNLTFETIYAASKQFISNSAVLRLINYTYNNKQIIVDDLRRAIILSATILNYDNIFTFLQKQYPSLDMTNFENIMTSPLNVTNIHLQEFHQKIQSTNYKYDNFLTLTGHKILLHDWQSYEIDIMPEKFLNNNKYVDRKNLDKTLIKLTDEHLQMLLKYGD